jgi:hypothetical protein
LAISVRNWASADRRATAVCALCCEVLMT